jgi:hypothetical protein
VPIKEPIKEFLTEEEITVHNSHLVEPTVLSVRVKKEADFGESANTKSYTYQPYFRLTISCLIVKNDVRETY